VEFLAMRMIAGAILLVAAAILAAAGMMTEQIGRSANPPKVSNEYIAYLGAGFVGFLGMVMLLQGQREPPGQA
jgi:hypothetical protein